jgi:hypothetical protein
MCRMQDTGLQYGNKQDVTAAGRKASTTRHIGRQYNDANSDVNNDVGRTLTASDAGQSDKRRMKVRWKTLRLMLQSAPKLHSDGGAIRHAWDVYGKRQHDECRTAAWCCVVANCVVAVLHVLLQRCSLRCCDTTAFQVATLWHSKLRRCGAPSCNATALQVATLRRSKLRCCGAPSCDVAMLQVATLRHYKLRRCSAPTRVAALLQRYAWLQRYGWLWRCGATCGCNAVVLQLAWLRHCGTACGCNAVALQLAWLRHYTWLTTLRCCGTTSRCDAARGCDVVARVFFFFFFEWHLASSKVINLFLYMWEREKQRARDNFETCFGLALPGSSALVWS